LTGPAYQASAAAKRSANSDPPRKSRTRFKVDSFLDLNVFGKGAGGGLIQGKRIVSGICIGLER